MTLTAAQRDRAWGALLGTAAGDALGAGYEFDPPMAVSNAVSASNAPPDVFVPPTPENVVGVPIVMGLPGRSVAIKLRNSSDSQFLNRGRFSGPACGPFRRALSTLRSRAPCRSTTEAAAPASMTNVCVV